MEELISSTKAFFASRHIRLSDEWLESCIEWIHAENTDQAMQEDNMHREIYQQWLYLDLREVAVPQLPAHLLVQPKFVLSDVHCLQVMQVIDISRSKMSQLKSIRCGVTAKKGDEEYERLEMLETGKRMLQVGIYNKKYFIVILCISVRLPVFTVKFC